MPAGILNREARGTIDHDFADHCVGLAPVDVDEEACNLLAALERGQGGADLPAAVDRGDGGAVELVDEVGNIACLLGPPESGDRLVELGGGDPRATVGVHATPGRRRELTARARSPAGDLGDVGEGIPEDVVQDERHPLGRGQPFEHDQHGHAHGFVE